MIKLKRSPLTKAAAAVAMMALLSACGSDNDGFVQAPPPPPPAPAPEPEPEPEPVNVVYDVTVTNLTNAQPLSPVAVVLHTEGNLWMVGESASAELEQLAEGGDNSGITGLSVATASASGAAPIGPGGSETIRVTIEDTTDAYMSVVTMLVNTNDAFTGVNAQTLSALEVGDMWSTTTGVYDSGTEANSEESGTIPGPADGGEGFAEARDDVDFVAMHPGVVSADDGLTNSVLTVQHKFDNPAMRVQITRVE